MSKERIEAEKLAKDFFSVGVKNPDLRVFDIVMYTPFGTTYNAYIIKGTDKNVLIEAVKEKDHEEMMLRIEDVISEGEHIDYVVHNHTEPDHSGSSFKLLELFPEATIVASEVGLKYLKEIGNERVKDMKTLAIESLKGEGLDLGGKTLQFYNAPFLHWPDSIFTFCPELGALFGCDFLGCHYSFADGKILDSSLDEVETANWEAAFKDYFAGIFGPFKSFSVDGLNIMTEEIGLENIKFVGTSHGPILTKDGLLKKAMDYYYENSLNGASLEDKFQDKVTIAYVSAYGYTGEMTEEITRGIEAEGLNVKSYDVTYLESLDELTAELTSSRGILFGSPTILGDVLPNIYQFLALPYLNPIISNGQVAGSFGSYGWSGEASLNIDERLKQLKMKLPQDPLRINFRRSEEDILALFEYGQNFAKAVKGEAINLRTIDTKALVMEDDDIFAESVEYSIDESRAYKCIICGHSEELFGDPTVVECVGCMNVGDIWEEIGGGSTAVESFIENTYRCQICMTEILSEGNPDQCPACLQEGDIFDIINEGIPPQNVYQCMICTAEVSGEIPPEQCPVCRQEGDIWKTLTTSVETSVEDVVQNDYNGTVAIIGGGIAGVTAAKSIREVNKEARVLLFSEEGLPYNRTSITKTPDFVPIMEEGYYGENNIELVKVGVSAVDNSQLLTEDGEYFNYDQLIVATGASPFNPFPPADNIFCLYSPEGQKTGTTSISGNVVIVGAGVLGVEASQFIWKNNPDVESVSFIDMAPTVLSINYQDERASMFLQDYLEKEGFTFFMNDSVKEFNIVDGSVKSLELVSGKTISCDAVVASISNRANIELVNELGIDIEPRGIVVDEFMRTSDPSIFAAGDCNAFGFFDNYNYGMIQGRTAGLNAIGIEESLVEEPLNFNCKVFDFNSNSFSLPEAWLEKRPPNYLVSSNEEHYFKFFFDNDENVVELHALALRPLNGMNLKKSLNKNVYKVLKNVKRLFG